MDQIKPDNMSLDEAFSRVLGVGTEETARTIVSSPDASQRAAEILERAMNANGFVQMSHLQSTSQNARNTVSAHRIYVEKSLNKHSIANIFAICPTAVICYVLEKPERTRPTRIVTSEKALGMKLGDWVDVYEAYENDVLGKYQIVGILRKDNDRRIGAQPQMLLAHAEFIR